MMNYQGAVAYGKMVGCKYYVYNSNGGLMGGSTTREGAEKMLREFEEEFKTDPWNNDMTFKIREV